MKVRSLACILDEEVRCVPGQILELRDEIAEIYLKRNLVARVREPQANVELAIIEGPPETAIGRRQRGRPKRSV